MKHLHVGLAAGVAALSLATTPAVADTAPPGSATVVMSDTGFTPAAVAVSPGATVTWVNHGTKVHTAQAIGGAPFPFDTAGIGPSQSASAVFGTPGNYYYSSATDCLNGNFAAQFPCGTSFIVIVSTSMDQVNATTAALAPPPPAASPTPNPAASGVPVGNANVVITDQGITPPTVTVVLGGSVTFANHGSVLHSAASPGSNTWQGFDSGGLTTGHGATFTMGQAGTFSYTSSADCVGSHNPQFDCGPYTIVVVPPNAVPAPQPAPPAPLLPPLPAPNPNTAIAVDDANGFNPQTLTIKAGQSVTWTNRGSLVHSVTSDPGLPVSFDSGGLSTGATFTFQFTTPGSYPYHSQPDIVFVNTPGCNCSAATYPTFGSVINVTP